MLVVVIFQMSNYSMKTWCIVKLDNLQFFLILLTKESDGLFRITE